MLVQCTPRGWREACYVAAVAVGVTRGWYFSGSFALSCRPTASFSLRFASCTMLFLWKGPRRRSPFLLCFCVETATTEVAGLHLKTFVV
ncbi:hypothetical protein CSUI_000914 [Cystoisospora suis]|uniref:Uncharacterized protein n=1 Tax=Cystoisospora suis TaxID=483139 RepID=A0A2C6KZ82_9APIC|nr:hypothetical protein CSUI_000914 [Cystoisospora suis]